jgi:hypothetical protein
MPLSSNDPYLSRFEFTSTVPWILVGVGRDEKYRQRDTVLASGGRARTELVGFVREQEFSGHSAPVGRLLEPIPAGSQFGAVISEGIPPSSGAVDKRTSRYIFAWEGRVRNISTVDEQFHRSLPDLLVALEDGSSEDLEWAIARLVFTVHENVQTNRRRRQLVILIALTEILVVLLVAIVVLSVSH